MAGIRNDKQLRGLNKVLKNLRGAIYGIKGRTATGFYEAALIVKADAVRFAPIDLSNLRGSCFVMVTGGASDARMMSFYGDDAEKLNNSHTKAKGEMETVTRGDPKKEDKIVGVVAFSAYYAWYVHEMPAHYNFNQGGPRFLARSMQKNQKRILQSIIKHAKV